jgi:UDP-N-acetylmuramate: L-alanyl-gamma-D-glutamyl-meso-diaminopimelate ligase
MRIHFISIGGAVMHNLALELHAGGHQVTGSDDEVYDPSKSRLEVAGLLPAEMGWNAERIDDSIDLILLGMHARPNNPELIKAQELKLKIQSFPEFIGEHARDKKQVIAAGSHGKTTTTSMIMHVLKENNLEFDYLVGAQIEGFDRMVGLSDAPVIVIEGDEYLSSPIDRTPKFLHYDPDLLILTGIQWDHMNVFPTFESYVAAFLALLQKLKPTCKVFYDKHDENLVALMTDNNWHFNHHGYQELDYVVRDGKFYPQSSELPFGVIGGHNMKNLSAAKYVLSELSLSESAIDRALQTFKGAAKRQDLLLDTDDVVIYRDFAHAPSKVRATLKGVRELYPDRHLVAVCELHTYSSLNKDFLPQYENALSPADSAAVFYSPKTLEIKKMPALEFRYIRNAFDRDNLNIFTDPNELLSYLLDQRKSVPCVLLLMSSGTFGGMDLNALR